MNYSYVLFQNPQTVLKPFLYLDNDEHSTVPSGGAKPERHYHAFGKDIFPLFQRQKGAFKSNRARRLQLGRVERTRLPRQVQIPGNHLGRRM